jgi:hypothetical protein
VYPILPAVRPSEGVSGLFPRKVHWAMTFTSSWREAMVTGLDLQDSVGPFYSAPLMVNAVLYVGSGNSIYTHRIKSVSAS